jgi:hypothetical protein
MDSGEPTSLPHLGTKHFAKGSVGPVVLSGDSGALGVVFQFSAHWPQ